MKKSTYYVLATILLFSIDAFAQSDKYSKGYQIGWEKGYCYEGGYGCTSPIPPLSPLPKIDENSYSYENGYNRGFTDGQRAKNSNQSQVANSSTDMYTPANFGEYVEPLNVNLIKYALSKKQANYNRARNSDYQVEVDKAINSSTELYNQVMKYLIENASLFKWSKQYQVNLNAYYNPTKIVAKYPSNMSYNQAGQMVGELQENYNATVETSQTIGRIVQTYIDNPNNILEGYYEVQSIEDLAYNQETNSYEHLNSIASDGKSDSYLYFSKNSIKFKRPDSEIYLESALKFDKLENGYYKFQDGHGQMIMITKDNVFLSYYYEPNSKGVYTKMTSYLVMNDFNFTR